MASSIVVGWLAGWAAGQKVTGWVGNVSRVEGRPDDRKVGRGKGRQRGRKEASKEGRYEVASVGRLRDRQTVKGPIGRTFQREA